MSCGLAFCRSSITPGPDGNLWFTSTSAATQAAGGCHGDVGRITPDGTITLGYALERSSRCGAAGCGGPTPDVCTYTDIATGPDGALWFTSESAIRRLSPDSALIATGAGAGGAAHVKLFGVDGVSGIPVQLGGGFLAYDPGFLGGVQAAVVAVGADVFVVTGVGSGGGPHIRLFQVTSFDDWTVAPVGGGFFAYDLGFTGGVRVAATTTAGSLLILTGVGQGGGAHVKVFQVTDLTTGAVVQLGGGFFAYDPGFLGGVNVGAQ
jgi:hypothetical protein